MPGDGLLDPVFIPPALYPAQVVVCNYNPDRTPKFIPLPNVRLVSDQCREGPTPPVARYRYDFADFYPPEYPRRLEDIFRQDVPTFDYNVVIPDDRVAALEFYLDGTWDVLADGFAITAQGDAGDDGETVTFECSDVSVREFDRTLEGSIWRHADKHGDPGAGPEYTRNDFLTSMPVRFNPDGRPNATPAPAGGGFDYDSGAAGADYPVFLDPLLVRSPDVRRHWTVGMAARYIMAVGNPDKKYVKLPDEWATIDDFLVDMQPTTPGGVIDPEDPATFTRVPILVPDLDVTGLAWPDALQRLIEPHGFGMFFRLYTMPSGAPEHRLMIFRRDIDPARKAFGLQKAEPGAVYDLAQTNVGKVTFQDDMAGVVNEVVVRSELTRREVSVVLAPLFEVDAADAATPEKYRKEEGSEFAATGNSLKYRMFGVDETGDGHWDFDSSSSVIAIPSLDGLFRDGGLADDPDDPAFVRRRRPASQFTLFYEVGNRPINCELWVAADYTGPTPGVYDPSKSAHWQKVGMGGWKLLDDRLGILVTTPDPSKWPIGRQKDMTGKPFPGGKINVLRSLAAPDTAHPKFAFRLTCVVESDRNLGVVAVRRDSTPTRFTIRRPDDAEDRFRQEIAMPSSHYVTGGLRVNVEDDTAEATAYAEGRRRAHELGKFSASVVVPYIDSSYQIADKITGLVGRDIGFNQLVGAEAGERPVYPAVVARERVYEPQQTTTYLLNDARFEGHKTANFNYAPTAARARQAAGVPVATIEAAQDEGV